MPIRTASDAELLEKAVGGDASAYGDLYERHLDRIYRYIYYRIGDQAEAEDMTEMVFLRVWQSLPHFDASRSPFTAWLYRVAHNLVVDHYRTRRTHQELPETLPSAADDQPENVAMERDERRRLVAALSRLSRDHQEVLALRFVSGLNHEQAAQTMGRSPGAVRVLQHRALQALRKVLLREEAGAE